MKELYAKLVHPDWGMDYDKKQVREVGLEVGRKKKIWIYCVKEQEQRVPYIALQQ